MLYLFDNQNKLAKAVAQFRAKHPAGAVYQFDLENWESGQERFAELLASGIGLFGEKNLIVLREVEELTTEQKAQIKASDTIVLWCVPAASKSFEPNPFALANLLPARDGTQLWLGYQRALAAGLAPEALFWPLAWQVRQMLCGARPQGKFSQSELAILSARFVALWHETKREEGRDFPLELEHLLLSV